MFYRKNKTTILRHFYFAKKQEEYILKEEININRSIKYIELFSCYTKDTFDLDKYGTSQGTHLMRQIFHDTCFFFLHLTKWSNLNNRKKYYYKLTHGYIFYDIPLRFT